MTLLNIYVRPLQQSPVVFCTTLVNPKALRCFTCSRLIAFDKQPGVRPVGIGEVSRRIIATAVLSVIKEDILRVAGVKELCIGHRLAAWQPSTP